MTKTPTSKETEWNEVSNEEIQTFRQEDVKLSTEETSDWPLRRHQARRSIADGHKPVINI